MCNKSRRRLAGVVRVVVALLVLTIVIGTTFVYLFVVVIVGSWIAADVPD